MIGKAIRLERIIDRNSHNTVIVPMDHGVTVGPIAGLANMRTTIGKVVSHRQAAPRLPPPPLENDESRELRDMMANLSSRLERLEEERGFYKDLLDPPDRRLGLESPGEPEAQS